MAGEGTAVAQGQSGHEVELDREARDELRERSLNAAPRFYNPWVHLAIPSVFGIVVFAGCVALLQEPTWRDALMVPVTWVLANIGEWRVHKYWLHRRSRLAPVLYDQHTPMHHMVYLTDDMEIRSARELRLVLIPAYGIMLIFLSLLVPSALLWWAGYRNVALLFVATEMYYVLSYEWLHLSYHLPRDSFIGRRKLIGWLRNHHAVHHDPRLMQRLNFNVTVPFWDWVMGTMVRTVDEGMARKSGR
jgi:hypothetical protein